MTTAYSVGYTKYVAGRMTDPGEWGAKVTNYYDEYEAAALAAGSTIYMFIPKAGARWTGVGQLAWDDQGAASQTLSVGVGATLAGTSAVADAFLAATDAATAADMAMLDAGAAAITYLGYEFDGGTGVTITTAEAGSAAGTGTIKLSMLMFGV